MVVGIVFVGDIYFSHPILQEQQPAYLNFADSTIRIPHKYHRLSIIGMAVQDVARNEMLDFHWPEYNRFLFYEWSLTCRIESFCS